jgi:hypothetical protein
MLTRFPKSKRDAVWVNENIDPKSSIYKKQLIVLNNEGNYCYQCFYLIGVVTHDQKTDYSLQLDLMDADFANAQILKLGELYTTTFKKDELDQKRVYRFMIDEISPIQFIQSAKNARIRTVVSFFESG